jgi:outer membrane immunogenic protein
MHRYLGGVTAGAAVVGVSILSAGGAAAQDAVGWTGWYLGGAIEGYSSSLTEDETTDPGGVLTGQFAYSGDGFGAGLFAGRNWQHDTLIYGVEVGAMTGPSLSADINSVLETYTYDPGLMLSVKGRAGYLVRPDTLVFASAGLSMGNLDYDWTVLGQSESGTVWTQGYSVGFGVERQFGEGNALRLGVDYIRRDSDSFRTPAILPGFSYSNDLEQVAVSVGFVHYFGD